MNYFKSEEVKVFPSAYRGSTDNKQIDPESRIPTERNYVRMGFGDSVKQIFRKDSYIVSLPEGNSSSLCVVVGGYYFELTGTTVTNIASQANVWLYILTTDKTISGDYKTPVLASLKTGANEDPATDYYLDDGTDFVGLAWTTAENEAGEKIKLKVRDGNNWNKAELLPQIEKTSATNINFIDPNLSIEKDSDNTTIKTTSDSLMIKADKKVKLTTAQDTTYNLELTDTDIKLIHSQDNENKPQLQVSRNNINANGNATFNLESNEEFKVIGSDTSYFSVNAASTPKISIGSDAEINADKKLKLGNITSNAKELVIKGINDPNETSPIKFQTYSIDWGQMTVDYKDAVVIHQSGTNATSSSTDAATGTLEVKGGIKSTTGNNYFAGTITTGENLTITSGGLTVTGTTKFNNNVNIGSSITLDTAGQIQASSFHATSDRRLKENIIDYIPKKSILDLPVKQYNYIGRNDTTIGCIAQDLQEICPELVRENDKGYLSIEESKLVYLLLDEVKKLKQEVDELKKAR